jgi:hypothetical protein
MKSCILQRAANNARRLRALLYLAASKGLKKPRNQPEFG